MRPIDKRLILPSLCKVVDTLDDLLKRQDEARERMTLALEREIEAGEKFTQDAARFEEWQKEKAVFNQALHDYSVAHAAYLEAMRKS